LFNCLISQNIGIGDEVIVSSFTCDAVTNAVMRTGATVIYSDINDNLTMRSESVLRAITKHTKAVVMQDTFGKVGLDFSTIDLINKQNILLIEDCALSYGSALDGENLGCYGDFSFSSLEVSKTVTIGWGGVLLVNNSHYRSDMLKRLESIKRVRLLQDIRRFLQLYLSVFLIRKKPIGGVWIWYFLYGSRIFRKSNSYNLNTDCRNERMGRLSQMFYNHIHNQFDDFYRATNRNYLFFTSVARKLDLHQPVVEQSGEFIVSPRFSLMIRPENIQLVVDLGRDENIEVGRWFDEVPPSWNIKRSRIESSMNASRISASIINFPCHWTLSKDEVVKIEQFMHKLSLIDNR